MARTKKTEEKNEVKPVEKVENFGTGWARVNNMLQAGYTIEEIKGVKRNE